MSIETGSNFAARFQYCSTVPVIRMAIMHYRVFSGPRGVAMPSGLAKERMLYKEFGSLDGAFAWARHVNKEEERVALLIEGDDGTHLAKEEIVAALHHPDYARPGEGARNKRPRSRDANP
jgi:hypothetical protein